MKIGVFVGSAPMSFSARASTAPTVDLQWGDPSESVQQYSFADTECYVMRRHGAQSQIAPHAINYRANLWQMKSLGVDAVIGTHTVGSIDPNLAVGGLVIPHNLIDYTWGRESTFDDHRRHVEFSEPYDAGLCTSLAKLDSEVLHGGVYGCTQGPRLETAAEIARLANDGCTLVGMTGMPEASLARELEIPFASICLIVNPAAGLVGGAIDMAALREISTTGAQKFVNLIERFCGAQ
ncbi:MAG: S-methyl-5'-thioinosine phosphorylase [Pseudomonadales bacterium]|nr:S-methyl-5'-thioinosine phosphorylase [Pseudomonadales bacterium]